MKIKTIKAEKDSSLFLSNHQNYVGSLKSTVIIKIQLIKSILFLVIAQNRAIAAKQPQF
jgi:hypothetical protein